MCGIIGARGKNPVLPFLVQGLRSMEYRGYDSCGVAVVRPDGIAVRKDTGPISRIEAGLDAAALAGGTGIGHQRWATHGGVTAGNAHPHADCAGRFAIVHNGIIENHQALAAELAARGHVFRSETDSEVIAHLIEEASAAGKDFPAAVRAAAGRLRGAFAFAAVAAAEPDMLVGVRNNAPLLAGFGRDASFLASDPGAFGAEAESILLLENGEMIVLGPDGHDILAVKGGKRRTRALQPAFRTEAEDGPGDYPDFMQKEIFEQPAVIERIIAERLDGNKVSFPEVERLAREFWPPARILLAACGTAFHAAKIGEYLIEQYGGLPAKAELASEFRYRFPAFRAGDWLLLVSQSGETADTLAALREAKAKGVPVLALVNVAHSTLAREADAVILQGSGPERSVASTKAFVSQAALLALFACHLGREREYLAEPEAAALFSELRAVPGKMRRTLALSSGAEALARKHCAQSHFFFIGRVLHHPVAAEGALKLKEISYAHAEGYAAGELKHGPLALIEPGFPVICIAPRNRVYDKMISNIQEVRARGGNIVAVATEGDAEIGALAGDILTVPETAEAFEPLLAVLPLQLFAYHFARNRGCDVDHPRNLAKSVTVE